VHYHFTDVASFLKQVSASGFIEHAEVFGNYYGTSQAEVERQLSAGHDVLLEIDWQGAEQVRRLFPDSIQIFIVPPSQYDLRERLSSRAQDSIEVIEQRLAGAITDMQQYVHFDYLIINDVFDHALHDIEAIIHSSRLTVKQQAKRHQALIEALLTPQSRI
jgi:guanylate kinase